MEIEKYDTLEAKLLLDIAEVMRLSFAKQLREKKYSIEILTKLLWELNSIQENDRENFKNIEQEYKENIARVEREFEQEKSYLEKCRHESTIFYHDLYIKNNFKEKEVK